MKPGFRQAMAELHTWSGILPGWILYFMFLTGTSGYFAKDIDLWMRPELPLRSAIDPSVALVRAWSRLQHDAPDAARWSIDLSDSDRAELQVAWFATGGRQQAVFLHGTDTGPTGSDDTGIEPRDTGGGRALYQMHWGLSYLPPQAAYWIVGICAMALLIALISGSIVHRRIFKDFFTFRPGKDARSWLDAHTVLGVMALPYYVTIAYTGLVLMMSVYWPALMHEIERFDDNSAQLFDRAFNQLDARDPEDFVLSRTGTAAPLVNVSKVIAKVRRQDGRLLSVDVLNPGDVNARVLVVLAPLTPLSRLEELVINGATGEMLYGGAAPSRASEVNEVLTGLHEAKYAGTLLRWLYFLSGLMGAAMIATGLIHWTRRRKHGELRSRCGVALVERLNVGVIAGLPVAIAAYFWANRLLPLKLADRADWELHTIFLVWLGLLLFAVSRPLNRSWFGLLRMAALAYGLLPLLNALTTNRHLGVTLPYDHWRGDWQLAGVDLTMLALGLIFSGMAWGVWRRVEAHQSPLPAAGALPSLHAELAE